MLDANSVAEQDGKRRFRPADLVDLFTRPRRFFSAGIHLGDPRLLVPFVWIVGITAQVDRVDTEIMRHNAGQERVLWGLMEALVSGPWPALWAWLAGVGVVTGLVHYFVGGWWYRLRLRFAGAPKETGWELPRHLYLYSTMIVALPQLVITLILMLMYPSYIAAYNSDETLSVSVIFFLFYSVAISYVGVRVNYELSAWKVRLWFLALPFITYLALTGGVVWLLTLLQ